MPFQSLTVDKHFASLTVSRPSAAVATISAPSQAPVILPPTGEILAGTPQGTTDEPVVPPHIPFAGPNGVVITTPHPRLANNPPKIYREGPIGSGSRGHRALYLASPLAEPSGTYQVPSTNHVRTMGLKENRVPVGSSGRIPLFYTPNEQWTLPPLAETNNIGRYTNRQRRTEPQLRFQFERREPQRPPRPVRRPEPVVEILEEDGAKDEVRMDLEAIDDDGMDLFYLNSAVLF